MVSALAHLLSQTKIIYEMREPTGNRIFFSPSGIETHGFSEYFYGNGNKAMCLPILIYNTSYK